MQKKINAPHNYLDRGHAALNTKTIVTLFDVEYTPFQLVRIVAYALAGLGALYVLCFAVGLLTC